MKLIPHSKPWLTEEDIAVLADVLRSGMLGQGERTKDFECAISQWVGAGGGGVAVGSGSAALLLALMALSVGTGDEVVFPTYICAAVLEAVLTTGAKPILCDVGCNWVVTAENMADRLTRKTKALIIPHMYGIYAEVKSFRAFGIPIIEDSAQAIDYQGKREIVGDIAVFSFHPTKCLTTGEGGMAVSSDPDLVAVMRSIRDGVRDGNQGRFFTPMSDLAASLGLSQLSRYNEALDRRQHMAQKYTVDLKKIIPDSLQTEALANSMYFRFPVKISGGLDAYQVSFAKKNICVRRGVGRLLHRLINLSDDKFPEAVALYNTTVSLPLYPALTNEEHAYCVETAVAIFSTSRSKLMQ